MWMNWLQLGSLQLHWVHEISQSALAAAVATLGLVIMLELRSISRLRRAVDAHLMKVLEQLDLLRSESQQLIEAQARSSTPSARNVSAEPPINHSAPAAGFQPPALASGEARLLASITAARARLKKTEGDSAIRSVV